MSVDKPRPAPRPRRAGLFTQVPKRLVSRLIAHGCTLQEIGLYMAMYTAPETSAVGYIYRRHEWDEIASANHDSIDLYLDRLQDKELIVMSGASILLTGYMAEQAFNQPKYLKSGLWDLQRSLDDKPLLRFIVGVQLLGLDAASMAGTKAESARDAAQPIWAEITGDALPPVRHMHGSFDEPNPTMIDSLARMPDAVAVRTEMDRRQWCGVPAPLRGPLQAAFDELAASSVTTFRPRHNTGG